MHLSYSEPDPVYPFQRVKYTDGSDTGIIMIAAPFYDTNYYRRGHNTRPPLVREYLQSKRGWSLYVRWREE